MKTKAAIISIILVAITFITNAQEQAQDYLWTYEGKNKTYELGIYGELSWDYSTLGNDNIGWLGAKAGVVINQRWAFGVTGKALAYDKHLTDLSSEGEYRLESGYSGMFVEYLQPVSENLKLAFTITSAQGIALYRYEDEYAEDLPWHEEIIDVETYGVFEPQVAAMLRVKNNWWIEAHASARNTSPVKMTGTDEKIFTKLNAGIAVKYGIF
jgi:hypothetical protein